MCSFQRPADPIDFLIAHLTQEKAKLAAAGGDTAAQPQPPPDTPKEEKMAAE